MNWLRYLRARYLAWRLDVCFYHQIAIRYPFNCEECRADRMSRTPGWKRLHNEKKKQELLRYWREHPVNTVH